MGDTRKMGLALIGTFDWKATDVAGLTVAPVAPAATFAWAVGLKWVGSIALAVVAVFGLRASFGATSADLEPASIDRFGGLGLVPRTVEERSGVPKAARVGGITAESIADDQESLATPEGGDESASATTPASTPIQPVRVIDHAGAPVPDARVFQRGSEGFEFAARTGPDGMAEVVFTPKMLVERAAGRGGTGVGLVARAPSYAESTEYFIVAPAPGAAPVTLQLPGPGQTLTGVVLGTDGRPLANALVVLDPLALENGETREPPFIPGPGGIMQRRLTRRAITEADGTFRFPGLTQTPHPILVTREGYTPKQVYAGDHGHAEASCVVSMTAGGRVQGVVRHGSGEPAVGVSVEAQPLDVGFGLVRQAQTDEEGRFDLNHLAGGRIRVRAQSDGAGVATLKVEIREGGVQHVELELAPEPSFEVSLVDMDGKALPGFGIAVSQLTTEWSGGIKPTNAAGLARFVGFPEGELIVQVLKRGIQSPLSVHALDPVDGGSYVIKSVREHAALGKLSGSVLVNSESPPALARIRVNQIGVDAMMTTPILDASGRFEVSNLPGGTYELMLQTPSKGLVDLATIELNGTDYELGVVDLAPIGTVSVEWGWPANEASTYRLVERYSMDAGAHTYNHFIAEGAAPPPSEFHVFEGDYEFIVSSPSGETIRTTRFHVRPGLTKFVRLDSSD